MLSLRLTCSTFPIYCLICRIANAHAKHFVLEITLISKLHQAFKTSKSYDLIAAVSAAELVKVKQSNPSKLRKMNDTAFSWVPRTSNFEIYLKLHLFVRLFYVIYSNLQVKEVKFPGAVNQTLNQEKIYQSENFGNNYDWSESSGCSNQPGTKKKT